MNDLNWIETDMPDYDIEQSHHRILISGGALDGNNVKNLGCRN